jgi:L,D-transpeptidase YcbB
MPAICPPQVSMPRRAPSIVALRATNFIAHITTHVRPTARAASVVAGAFAVSSQRLAVALAIAVLLLAPWRAFSAATDGVPLFSPTLSEQIAARLQASPPLTVKGLVLNRVLLAKVYQQRADGPIWVGHADWTISLEKALAEADTEAIAPDTLGQIALHNALADPALPPAERDLILTDRFLTYAAILARGRVDISSIEELWILPAPVFDPMAAIASLVAGEEPEEVLHELTPSSPAYGRLRAAYARYREIAAVGGWKSLPVGSGPGTGDAGSLMVELADRLIAEGDLPADRAGRHISSSQMAAAVGRFQQRHGLLIDGRVGPATLAALNVSPRDRIRQLALNLERLRAMPRTWPATRIEAEQSSQMLTYYRDGEPVLVSRIIVGQPAHPTPVLETTILHVVLDPTWFVPVSIIQYEIQPRLGGDSAYLLRNHFEIMGRGGGDPTGRDLDWKTTDLLAMGWKLRQLSGPWNALGSVLFDMPNRFDVYLHDTPYHNVFGLPQRALSHGCVRVDLARDLAGALLGAPLPAPGGTTRAAKLGAKVPVYFLYETAFVDVSGMVEFRDDIYGRDKRLADAIAAAEAGTRLPAKATATVARL